MYIYFEYTLSPKTNHTGKKKTGTAKGGLDRTNFFRTCEASFDKRSGFLREPEQSLDFLNAMKNASSEDIRRLKQCPEQVKHETSQSQDIQNDICEDISLDTTQKVDSEINESRGIGM